jgi:hypothetical protein
VRRLAVLTVLAAALVAAWPAAGTPGSVRPCRASYLRASLFLNGATGSLIGGVRVTNRTEKACSVAGLPRARLVGAGKTHYATVFHIGGRGGLPGSGPASVLRSGWSATTYMQWWNWCRQTRPRIVLVLPRRGGTLRFRPHGTPRCDARGQRTTLVVTPFRKA